MPSLKVAAGNSCVPGEAMCGANSSCASDDVLPGAKSTGVVGEVLAGADASRHGAGDLSGDSAHLSSGDTLKGLGMDRCHAWGDLNDPGDTDDDLDDVMGEKVTWTPDLLSIPTGSGERS